MSTACLRCLKLSVFALNLIIWFVGVIGVCLAGFYLYLITKVDTDDRPDLWLAGASFADAEKMLLQARVVMCVVALVTGSLVIVIGLMGCCGAAADHRCLLVTYAGLLGVALAVQIVVIGIIVWQKDQAPAVVEELVLTKIKYSEDYQGDDWKAIHAIQQKLKCCGVNSYLDYVKVNHSIPISCCNSPLITQEDYVECNRSTVHPHVITNITMIFSRGCSDAIRGVISGYAIFGYTVITVLIGLQVVGFIFSCVIIRSLASAAATDASKTAQERARSASYAPTATDSIQQYQVVPPAYENPSRHSSMGGGSGLAR
ncbi:tetraspanin-9-like [Amphibalanus amphitrite]|uniref:tetraspanin-9-like n=1 Tax=Amphibalanus amphitrite TaxID=1232801 RepID=UPI001C906C83|nr:tetraspanin-9-like [Amphibalanus amphitrite]